MFHPWHQLRNLSHVIVEWIRPHPTIPAATDGERCIWLDPRMNQVERRCALTHELVHLEFGHVGCQPVKVERGVRVETARRLITVEQLVEWVPWALSREELASELWVTELVLADRLESLNAAEQERLDSIDFLYGC